MRFFEGGGEEKFKSKSLKEAEPLLIESGSKESLPVVEGETCSIDGLGDLEDLEDLWSRTVLTEVREGVVVVLEGLGLFLIKLELEED